MLPAHFTSIHDFFDYGELPFARRMLHKMIRKADAEKIWNGRSPSDLLFFTDQLQLLLEAAFRITSLGDFQPAAICTNTQSFDPWSLTNHTLFCGSLQRFTPWDYFPRHLSKKELLNPYIALQKFTRFKTQEQWKELLKDFLLHALSPRSIDELDDGTGILRCSHQLHKLLEACHLIHIRTIHKK